jgi:hypothetical protein
LSDLILTIISLLVSHHISPGGLDKVHNYLETKDSPLYDDHILYKLSSVFKSGFKTEGIDFPSTYRACPLEPEIDHDQPEEETYHLIDLENRKEHPNVLTDRHEGEEAEHPEDVDDTEAEHSCKTEIPLFVQLKPVISFNMLLISVGNPAFGPNFDVLHIVAPSATHADSDTHVDDIEVKVLVDHASLDPIAGVEILRIAFHNNYSLLPSYCL